MFGFIKDVANTAIDKAIDAAIYVETNPKKCIAVVVGTVATGGVALVAAPAIAAGFRPGPGRPGTQPGRQSRPGAAAGLGAAVRGGFDCHVQWPAQPPHPGRTVSLVADGLPASRGGPGR